MNGTLIALVEDIQIRRSVEHLSGKHEKKKKERNEKKRKEFWWQRHIFPYGKHSNPLR